MSIPRQPVKRWMRNGQVTFGLLPQHANAYTEPQKQILYRLVEEFASRKQKVGTGNVIDFVRGEGEPEFSVMIVRVEKNIYVVEKMLPHEVVMPE